MSILSTLRANDPDDINLRKALRAFFVCVPIYLLLDIPLDLPGAAPNAFLSAFTGLVFADFGGPPLSRVLAYLVSLVAGILAIIFGSLLSESIVGAAIGMFAVMFAVSFAGVFGGYSKAMIAPVALAYSLSVLEPLQDLALGDRVLGWTVGGTAAMVAAMVLWPVYRRSELRNNLANVCLAFADALQFLHEPEKAKAAYEQGLKALGKAQASASTPLRPAGPFARDVGLLHLVENLEQVSELTGRVVDGGWAQQADEPLILECQNALRRTAAILKDEAHARTHPVDIGPLDRALLEGRRLQSQAFAQASGQGAAGVEEAGAAAALAATRRSMPVFGLAHLMLWVETTAATAQGGEAAMPAPKAAPEVATTSDQPAEFADRFKRIIATGFDRNGVVFQNAVRAAAAMTLAVILAMILPLAHGFWITLGVLLVLRSSAASTSATAVQAVVGTALGFAVSAALLYFFADNAIVLWTVLVVGVFLAAYTPGVVSFMVGQVAFTTMVIAFFTIVDPQGITTAIVRLEAVAIGAVSAALMALTLWPRGARAALARAMGGHYRAAAKGLTAFADADATANHQALIALHSARRLSDEAFGIALSEQGNRRTWRVR